MQGQGHYHTTKPPRNPTATLRSTHLLLEVFNHAVLLCQTRLGTFFSLFEKLMVLEHSIHLGFQVLDLLFGSSVPLLSCALQAPNLSNLLNSQIPRPWATPVQVPLTLACAWPSLQHAEEESDAASSSEFAEGHVR